MTGRFAPPLPRHLGVFLAATAALLLLSACGAAAPAPTSTTAPKAAPTIAAAPAATGVQGDVARGDALFSSKGCNSCHSIGSGKVVGPDLKGVNQRRDRAWLVKWLNDPGAVVNSGDVTAKQLVAEYGRTMPSPGLNEQQAADVLAYIQSRS